MPKKTRKHVQTKRKHLGVSKRIQKRRRTQKKRRAPRKQKKPIAYRLCSCIQQVRRHPVSYKMTPDQRNRRAIGICIHSVLNRVNRNTKKKKRLYSFTCKKSKGGPKLTYSK